MKECKFYFHTIIIFLVKGQVHKNELKFGAF